MNLSWAYSPASVIMNQIRAGASAAFSAWKQAVIADGGTIYDEVASFDIFFTLYERQFIERNSGTLIAGMPASKVSVLYGWDVATASLVSIPVVRNSQKRTLGPAGVLVTWANNFPAFEWNTNGSYRGLSVEPGATNLALQSRDLSQAAWTKTGATATLTATGADGSANTASIVTATAGNATVLQAITSASASRIFSAYVRRRTGTGTVEITQDNGTTWTPITLTSSYQLFSTPNQTLTNPTVGFRIVTSGDEIDVDFTQAESGAIATSPIPTTGSTANRAGEVMSLTGASSLIGQTEGALGVGFRVFNAGTARAIATLFEDADNFIRLRLTTSNALIAEITTGGVSQVSIESSALTTDTKYGAVLSYANDSVFLSLDGAKVGTTDTSATIPATSKQNLGADQAGGSRLNGNLSVAVNYNRALTEAEANSLSLSLKNV